MKHILSFDDVTYIYHTRRGETVAAEHLSFSLDEGEFAAVIGPSGCGKTTLLSLAAGLLTPSEGKVESGGASFGYMLQKDELFPWRTVEKNLYLPLEIKKMKGDAPRKRVRALAEKYGLGGFLQSYPAQLSGGMRQRAALIRTLAADPDVLLMASFVSDALLFFNTCKEQQYTPNFIVGQRGGFIQSDYLTAMGDENNYICTTASWGSDITTAVTQELVELWANSEYNSEKVALMDSHVKDAMNLLFLAMAIEQAGTTENTALREALLNLEYDMDTLMIPWNGIEFNEYGQNTQSNGFITQYYDGAYRTVYPEAGASMEPVYPMPEFAY